MATGTLVRGIVVGGFLVVALCMVGLVAVWGTSAEAREIGEVEADKSAHTQAISDVLPFIKGENLSLSNGNGTVHVTSWERPEISIVATKRVQAKSRVVGWLRGGTKRPRLSTEEAQTYLDMIHVEVEENDHGVGVMTRYPRGRKKVSLSVSYQIHLPREAALDLETSNGEIRVSNIAGSMALRSSNGKLQCEDASGPVKATSSNGAIMLRRVAGSVEATTSNGRIEVERDHSPADDDRLRCRTSNGSITLRLPETSSFLLDASTSNGRIETDFPVTLSGKIDRDYVRGTVGGGGPKVCLRTSNGSISVRKQAATE